MVITLRNLQGLQEPMNLQVGGSASQNMRPAEASFDRRSACLTKGPTRTAVGVWGLGFRV